jgi:hypothetical protein
MAPAKGSWVQRSVPETGSPSGWAKISRLGRSGSPGRVPTMARHDGAAPLGGARLVAGELALHRHSARVVVEAVDGAAGLVEPLADQLLNGGLAAGMGGDQVPQQRRRAVDAAPVLPPVHQGVRP